MSKFDVFIWAAQGKGLSAGAMRKIFKVFTIMRKLQ